jgi:hypothetical protein
MDTGWCAWIGHVRCYQIATGDPVRVSGCGREVDCCYPAYFVKQADCRSLGLVSWSFARDMHRRTGANSARKLKVCSSPFSRLQLHTVPTIREFFYLLCNVTFFWSLLACMTQAAVLQGWPPGWQLVASPDGTSVWLICPNDAVGVQASPDSVAVSVGPPQGPAPNPRDAQMDLPQDPHERRKALFSELAPAVRYAVTSDTCVRGWSAKRTGRVLLWVWQGKAAA